MAIGIGTGTTAHAAAVELPSTNTSEILSDDNDSKLPEMSLSEALKSGEK